MTYYISAKRFYFEHKIKEGGYLAVEDSRFGDWTENVPEGAEVLDYSDYQISPGLVDTHIHGFAGYDVMDNSEESLLGMSQALLSAGVTSFLPTAILVFLIGMPMSFSETPVMSILTVPVFL